MAADYKTLLGLVREFLAEPIAPRSQDLIDRARAAIEPSKPKNDPSVLHVCQPDACCFRPFRNAAGQGTLDGANEWTCPKCGTVWRMVQAHDNVREWQPEASVAVVRR